MRHFRRLLCCLLLCTLLLGLLPSAGAASDGSDIIFLALNDTMPYGLSSGTMPYWSSGVLYVHSTTFDITSLNLSASYNAGNMTLLLYSGTTRRSLTFYLSDGYVQTQSGATEEVTAAMRGDQVFLPLGYCANFFGIGVSYLTSLQGWPLVRLTTGAQVWEDNFFIERADKLINERAAAYMGTTTLPPATVDPPVVQPPDVQPPVVDPPATNDPPADDPTPPPSDEPDEEDPSGDPEPPVQPDDQPATVYLALVGIDAAKASLSLLAAQELRAAVYLTAEEILEYSDLVRQIYAAGHCLGLAGDVDAANDALALVLCRRQLMTLDQQADGYLSHYATHNEATWEEIGNEPALLRLEKKSAAAILSTLLEQEAAILPLRETVTLFTEPATSDAAGDESTTASDPDAIASAENTP